MKKFLFPGIIILAIFLRFINFDNRWGLGYDQASFALVGKYAADAHVIPLLGPFSSSGPFQTGGEWYWLVAVGHILFPGIVIGPWIFMGMLSLVFVGAMTIIGVSLEGPMLGLMAALLSAVSTAEITQSTNLSNQTPIALFAALSIIAALAYQKSKKPHYLFFLGLGIGIASSIHLQGMGLLPLAIITILLCGVTLRGLLLLGLGLVLPWIPVLLADSTHGWYNTKNMVYYYSVDQYHISLDVLGRRWLTFGTQLIPNIWGFTIGGYWWTGMTTIITGLIVFKRGPLALLRGVPLQNTKNWFLVILSFIGMLIVVRYAHVPLYDSFLVFFHPFILIITAGIVFQLIKINNILGVLFLLMLLATSTIKNVEEITHATNLSAREAKKTRQMLTTSHPDTKFAVYDYQFQTAAKTLALLMYLDQKKLLDPNGHRIGISADGISDLQSSTSAELTDAHWAYLDNKIIYDSVQNWWKK